MLDTKEERQYDRLRKMAQELHIPIPEAFWTLEVFDKDGKLLQRHHQRSHSWTRNAYNVMFSQLASKNASDVTFEGGKVSLKDHPGGAIKSEDMLAQMAMVAKDADTPGTAHNGFLAGAGDDSYGILVGSGENAESFEDFALQTKIVSGSGAGELDYTIHQSHSISYGALVLTDDIIRFFNNNSGNSIDVNEVGIVCDTEFGGLYLDFLMVRDKLASTVAVPDTGQLKVTYTVQLTYPA